MKLNNPATISDVSLKDDSAAYCPPSPVMQKRGLLVAIRPVDPELEGKTFLGIYIGEIARSIGGDFTEEGLSLHFSMHNPAIFVPELGRVVFGIESWWSPIQSEDELRQITDEDIENIWYAKALNQAIKQWESES